MRNKLFKSLFFLSSLTSLSLITTLAASCNEQQNSEKQKENETKDNNTSDKEIVNEKTTTSDTSSNNLNGEITDNNTESENSENSSTPVVEKNDESSSSEISSSGKYLYDKSNNYYASLEGKRGDDLWQALVNLQNSKKSQIKTYGDLYDIFSQVDLDKEYENDGTILDIYSENPTGTDPYNFTIHNYEGKANGLGNGQPVAGKNSNDEGYIFNREHLIPQSWFKREPITRADPHFILPTDKLVNNKRGNLPHYIVENATWTSENGTKVNNDYAEPVDAFKGNVARMYFYFQVTHHNALQKANNGQIPGAVVFKDSYPYFTDNFLSTYQQWAKNDPVELFEIKRNNGIASYYETTESERVAKGQGMRNPFIDFPNLPDLIWGQGNETFHNLGILVDIKK
ncbi:endonuclease [Mycoplasmopsis meleagridis]|uniref:Endonuclease I n=1 Tax=Mycoplasmopsis meleagridis ATCC 25294 TaxID=1264554 RepID=A0A0F5H0X9_9BACT|nr:endonuclease [Mycoplasmopsis meleagridis]KKB26863.1 Endonuclease I [Mycoplasmopsis meleagridis ATCC 25294]VEU77398.1 Endonuclease I [Mycoplasmopsis meleagridis]